MPAQLYLYIFIYPCHIQDSMLSPVISLFQKSGIIKLTFLTLDLVHSHLTEAGCFGPMGHSTAWWNGGGGGLFTAP